MYSIGNSPDSNFFLPRTFLINLFEVGNCLDCLYSTFCGRCAIAETRSRLDGSSFYFNFFSLDLTTLRWLVRSSYSIGNAETYLEDSVLSWCCSCCVINQLYQTTRFYGNPTTDGGAAFNANPLTIEAYNENYWQEFGMAMCCGRFVRAELLNDAMGMPFWLGFCNVAPCLARNLLRYQYRLMPESDNDLIEECVLPMLYDGCCTLFCPWLSCFGAGCLLANDLVQFQQEVKSRRRPGYDKRYLTIEPYPEYELPITQPFR